MKSYAQLLADAAGRCAAVFFKLQLHFLALERERLERLYGRRGERTGQPDSTVRASVLQLLPPYPGTKPKSLSRRNRRTNGNVA